MGNDIGDQFFLNSLILDVVSKKHHSHCRLCLRQIQDEFLQFGDAVSLDPASGYFQPLNTVLAEVLGSEVSDQIPGLDAVCTECTQAALECYRFIDNYRNSTRFLNNVIDNVTRTIKAMEKKVKPDHSLYLLADELDTNIILIENPANDVRKKFRKHGFVCSECDLDLKTLQNLKDHHILTHNTLMCEKCHETFSKQADLEEHLNSQHRLKCPDCHQYRSSEESLREHQAKSHSSCICNQCGKSYKGIEKLKIHMESHNKKECPKCGKQYHTKDFYLRHTKLCLDGKLDPHPIRSVMVQPFTCEKCGKSYSTGGGLRVHERFVHGNAKPHICKWCNKGFTAPSYLKTHIIKHTGEKNFKCTICSRNFVSKEALLYHTRRHTGEKPYSCKMCGERFVNASARAEHIKFKHVGPTLMCEICSRKFVTKFFLKKHMAKHHDPTSKLYNRCGPANVPSEENMRKIKIEV